MPPCAAIEWARRGESWKQKQLTLYPSSPSVAAADPPARPEPTTIMECLRLLAGFTSFISKRVLSHFCSIGPDGILEFSSIYLITPTITLTGIEMYPAVMAIARIRAAFLKIGVCRG